VNGLVLRVDGTRDKLDVVFVAIGLLDPKASRHRAQNKMNAPGFPQQRKKISGSDHLSVRSSRSGCRFESRQVE
jgi:hypothetical protein